MAWHPNDLVTDADLVSYERKILSQFGVTDWKARRQKALEDWLFPSLVSRGFPPERLRTRHSPIQAVATTSSVTTDKTSAAKTENGLNLATILAASSDVLYIGFDEPFFGLSVRMQDSLSSATAGLLSIAAWCDGWTPVLDVKDDTKVGAVSFAKGGAITWRTPEQLVSRSINSQGPCYWVRLSISATPTGAVAGPWLVIRRSRLCAPVTFRTLALIFREAPTSQDGPWRDKADWYEQEADRAWLRVADHIGGEFDTDNSDAIDADEAAQTSDSVTGGGWMLQRC